MHAVHSLFQVAENSDVVFTIVGFPADVRETILGEDGVLAGLKPGGIIVDMTTSDPSLAREIAALAEEVLRTTFPSPIKTALMMFTSIV
jgi:3-hydroxyisobutyrate dehydrogenase